MGKGAKNLGTHSPVVACKATYAKWGRNIFEVAFESLFFMHMQFNEIFSKLLLFYYFSLNCIRLFFDFIKTLVHCGLRRANRKFKYSKTARERKVLDDKTNKTNAMLDLSGNTFEKAGL